MVNRFAMTFALTLAMLASAFTGLAQSPAAQKSEAPEPSAAQAEVLVLGTYHMSNPGHDIFNMQADDVLAPKRQAEIAQLLEVLKKFHPTKIAVEADGDRVAKRYADYQASKYELTRNEIDQIGLRLAKELGHKTVYAVDADGDFPYQHLVNYAKAKGRSQELDSVMSGFGDKMKAQDEYLKSHTILETLLTMNADEQVEQENRLYYQMAHFGEPADQAGPDLLSDWFRRNMRIYSNVLQLVDSPNERVLVIFGAGHLGWLRHDFASDPSLRLRKLAEFAQ